VGKVRYRYLSKGTCGANLPKAVVMKLSAANQQQQSTAESGDDHVREDRVGVNDARYRNEPTGKSFDA